MKPQVLVFIDWYKPFFKAGGPVRSLVNLVDHLQGAIDFHIVTGDRDYTATNAPADLLTDRWTTQDGAERVWYTSPAGRNVRQWKALLRERKWDAIYINGMWSRWSSLLPLWLLRGSDQRRIVAVRGMLAAGVMVQKSVLKRLLLLLMRTTGCFKGVEFQATSAEEVEDVKRWIGRDAKVHLVPNLGRKLERTAPLPIAKQPGELRLVSVGRIAKEKNTLFAIERLRTLTGDVRLDLYGTVYDEGYWQQCQRSIATLPSHVRVQWHGEVTPDQVSALLAKGHVTYMPSLGENFGHSMLESLSSGRPLLISDRTPWKGLEAQEAGWDLPLDRPEAFTAVLQKLVAMGPEEHARLMRGAFALASRSLQAEETTTGHLRMFSA
ncbi:MAG: glycosyltransferase family 4 protein [Flavobacteriales bacterium]|jgi:glycosyltransferase involved in cell wall biosynthesis|nr:glycosyltransferase family 4 protein [Flavobacteriales bacterium]